MPSPFGSELKKTRKQLYLHHHTHFQVLSLRLSLCSPRLMTNGGGEAELQVLMVCMCDGGGGRAEGDHAAFQHMLVVEQV